MNWLFRLSRWIHKYVGLLLILFVGWMSISGIVLNHPDWISGLSVPRWLVPPQYRIHDWSRGALRGAAFSEHNPSLGYIGGSQGVWKTVDGGRSFRRQDNGFPTSHVYRQVASLILCEQTPARLVAGTRGGLYVCEVGNEVWRHVPLGPEREPVRKILRVGDELLVFTSSHAYRAAATASSMTFQELPLPRANESARSVPLIRLFFDLHSGKIWGLAGQLLFDLAGLLLVFLCVSAFYIWYWPWRQRRRRDVSTVPRAGVYRWLLKYHLKLGIWSAAVLLIIGVTGFFMRPPMLVALAHGSVPAKLYPGLLPDNPWHEDIHNALYDAIDNRILIETRDGFWSAPADFSEPFVEAEFPAPIFVMGSTVLEPYETGGFLVGSFSGIFHLERESGAAIDLLAGRDTQDVSRMRPAELMATGYLRTPDGEEFVATHHNGLLPLGSAQRDGRFGMPAAMKQEFRLPLWNFLFELHNGRIFKDVIGAWYALVVPLGSLLFVLVLFSGTYDWCYARFPGQRQNLRR